MSTIMYTDVEAMDTSPLVVDTSTSVVDRSSPMITTCDSHVMVDKTVIGECHNVF